jgi:hypothetical protein
MRDDEVVPVTLPQGGPVDGGAFADLANGPEVTEALRRFYRYPSGRFGDPAPPRVTTWGSAQVRMVSALSPLMGENARLLEENARLRAELAARP